MLKYVRNPEFQEKLPGILNLFSDILTEDRSGLEDLRALLLYIFKAADRVDSRAALQYIESAPAVKENLMPTIAEYPATEALKKSGLEGKLEDARNFLALGIPLAVVLKATGLSPDQDLRPRYSIYFQTPPYALRMEIYSLSKWSFRTGRICASILTWFRSIYFL